MEKGCQKKEEDYGCLGGKTKFGLQGRRRGGVWPLGSTCWSLLPYKYLPHAHGSTNTPGVAQTARQGEILLQGFIKDFGAALLPGRVSNPSWFLYYVTNFLF